MAIQREYETTRERLRAIFKSKLLPVEDSLNYFRTMIPMDSMGLSAICGCLSFIHEDIGIDEFNSSGYIKFYNDSCIINSPDLCRYSGEHTELRVFNIKSQYRTLEFKFNTCGIWHTCDIMNQNAIMPLLANILSIFYRDYYTGSMPCNW